MLAAVAQICSTPCVSENLKVCQYLIKQAATRGARAIFFPEASDFIAENKQQASALVEPMDGNFVSAIKASALDCNIYVSIGVHEAAKSNNGMFFNTHLCNLGTDQ